MPFKPVLFFCTLIFLSCNNAASSSANQLNNTQAPRATATDKNPYTTIKAIPMPEGYTRVKADSNSFSEWLRNIKLKEDKTVYLFDGKPKANQAAQFAVMDISVGDKDLQQCADAVMRLRAEYLFSEKRYAEISFTDNENGVYTFNSPYTKDNFMNYMQKVFGMCGSASLSKQLKTVNDFSTIVPGDVLIRGGFPGHAEIVTDVAANKKGKKIFMLAQSYMPAQNIHILKNPASEKLSPWYEVNDNKKLVTPEYIFYKTELKRW